MSIHRLVKVHENDKTLYEIVQKHTGNGIDYYTLRPVNGKAQFTVGARFVKNVPYVTLRITNAQMKVVINNINDKHRRVKLNYSKSLLNFGDLFYRSQFGDLASKSQKAQPPYVMLYNNRHRIFIDVKALWWNEDGVVILYDVL